MVITINFKKGDIDKDYKYLRTQSNLVNQMLVFADLDFPRIKAKYGTDRLSRHKKQKKAELKKNYLVKRP